MPAYEVFADALGNALKLAKDAQVAVGHNNFIMNGQEGLIVQYDHSYPVSVSVFNALVKAGLKPIDGRLLAALLCTTAAEQSAEFKKMARELGTDESPSAFDRALRRIAPGKPAPPPEPKARKKK
jgi:hypothetical protein